MPKNRNLLKWTVEDNGDWATKTGTWRVVHEKHSDTGLWELYDSRNMNYGAWLKLGKAKKHAQRMHDGLNYHHDPILP